MSSKFGEILIVEDDAIISQLHKFSVTKMVKNEVKIFSNGKEALNHLEKVDERENQVLVLLDLNMPVMNGWEFLEACQEKDLCDDAKIVVVTSSPFRKDEQRARKYDSVIGYYTKPLKQEHLLEIFRKKEVARLVKVGGN